MSRNNTALVGVVGPCAAGKSTLVSGLRQRGYQARHIAQEHSYAPAMWQKITNPDVLIYLDVSYSVTLQRQNLGWTRYEYETQLNRLNHARENADLYIQTDNLTIHQILDLVLDFLQSQGSIKPDNPLST